MAQLPVDIVVGGSHKWLCGGPGCGFIYVRPDLRDSLAPAVTGWMAHADPFAFEPAPIRLATSAHRWNTGTPTIPGYLVARSGHDAILEIGVEAIRAHNLRLTDKLIDGAEARAFSVPTPLEHERRTGWIGMDFRGADKATAVAALMAHAPFTGRVPVYIGDDVTDEDGIRAAQARGGIGLRVADAFGDAAGVRAWLAALAA